MTGGLTSNQRCEQKVTANDANYRNFKTNVLLNYALGTDSRGTSCVCISHIFRCKITRNRQLWAPRFWERKPQIFHVGFQIFLSAEQACAAKCGDVRVNEENAKTCTGWDKNAMAYS